MFGLMQGEKASNSVHNNTSKRTDDFLCSPGVTAESSEGDRAALPLCRSAQSAARYEPNPFKTSGEADIPAYKGL